MILHQNYAWPKILGQINGTFESNFRIFVDFAHLCSKIPTFDWPFSRSLSKTRKTKTAPKKNRAILSILTVLLYPYQSSIYNISFMYWRRYGLSVITQRPRKRPLYGICEFFNQNVPGNWTIRLEENFKICLKVALKTIKYLISVLIWWLRKCIDFYLNLLNTIRLIMHSPNSQNWSQLNYSSKV